MTVHGVTWLLIRDDRVLLEQCPKKARVLGVGRWFVPGGKLEANETPSAALAREIAEEWPTVELLTFTPLPIIEGSPVGAMHDAGPRGPFLMRPYLVTVAGEIPRHDSEGTPLRWEPLDVALRSPVPQVGMMVAAAMAIGRCGFDGCIMPKHHGGEWHDDGAACWPTGGTTQSSGLPAGDPK